MLTRFGGFLYRARWGILLSALIVLIGAGIFGFGVFGRFQNGSYAPANSESTRADTLLNSKLGGSGADVVILMSSNRLQATDPAFMRAATALLSSLQKRPEVATLISYYSTESQSFVSSDGHETFAVLQLKSQDQATKTSEYKSLLPLFTSPILQITTGGAIPVNIAINNQINLDLEHAELFTFPIVALLLLIVFSGVIAAALPLFIGVAAILVAFAILHLLTLFTAVSSYATNIVTMLGLGLAIDYALFMVTRFREELALDEDNVQGALERTMATAGRTVLFSALTVSTSLISLMIFPLSFLRSMGMGAISAILAVLLISLTLLPALLAVLGKRINALSFRRRKRVPGILAGENRGLWYRLSETVMRWPIPTAVVVLAILLTLGSPFLHITFATPDVNVLPAGQESLVVSQQLSQNFAHQSGAQLTIAITTPGDALSASNLASLASYARSIEALPGVEQVESLVTVSPTLTLAQYQELYAHPGLNPQIAQTAQQFANGTFTKMIVGLQPAEHSSAAVAIVTAIRALHAPGGLVPLVDGTTPEQMDLLASLGATLPYALLVIIVSVFVLLFLMTGSLVMPLKAILLNFLSLSATFGGLVWIFQDGHLQNLLHFPSLGSIDATQPVLIFAVAFGLSMDYEVFLLSRIKERFDQTGDNRLAVASGLQRTGWLITSAALLLAIVLGAFSTARIIFVQELGIGLAIAVIVDATLIRMLLVPATMRLLGNLNWWAPAPLKRLWLRIGLREAPTSYTEGSKAELPLAVEFPTPAEV